MNQAKRERERERDQNEGQLPDMVAVPKRSQFIFFALVFAATSTLLLYVLGARVVDSAGAPGSLGLASLILIASAMLILASLAALFFFRRLQLPLEAARLLHGDQTAKLYQMEKAVTAASAAYLSVPKADDTDKLTKDLSEALSDLAAVDKLVHAVVAASASNTIVVDDGGRITTLSRAAAELTATTPIEATGRAFDTVFSFYDNTEEEPLDHPLRDVIVRALDVYSDTPRSRPVLLRNSAGEVHKMFMEVTPLRDTHDIPYAALVVLEAETNGAGKTKEVVSDSGRPMAMRDPMTGIRSAQMFDRRLHDLLQTARRSGSFHGLLMIGIDDIGKVHDRFGHVAGEEHIWQIAQLVLEHAPSVNDVYRLSAKHFAILAPERSDTDCRMIAQRLCSDVAARDFNWKGEAIPCSISIGIVSIGLADRAETEIADRAFHALGQAQELGGGRIFFESLLPVTLELRENEHALSAWLEQKLKSNHLRLAAQAIVPLAPDAADPSWVELLLRIEDDDGVWLPPAHYVDVLERQQLTSMIDKWVLETALQAGPRCDALKQRGGKLSINVFGASLRRDSFLADLRDVLKNSALPTQQICFELDESFVLQHPSRTAAFVETTAEFGCELALDRYRGGVGLTALRSFPANYIKLHESLVQRQTTDLIDRAHLDWLVTAAHLCGAKVVASAVRDAATLARLRQSKVDFVQGFAISPPGPYAL